MRKRRGAARFMVEVFAVDAVFAMLLITILNHCHRFPGFVYQWARGHSADQPTSPLTRVCTRALLQKTNAQVVCFLPRTDAAPGVRYSEVTGSSRPRTRPQCGIRRPHKRL